MDAVRSGDAGAVAAAGNGAGTQAQNHDQGQQKGDKLFHTIILLVLLNSTTQGVGLCLYLGYYTKKLVLSMHF